MPQFDDIPDLPLGPPNRAPAEPDVERVRRVRGIPLTRSDFKRRRRAAIALSAVWFAVQFAAFGIRGDLERLPALYVAGLVALPAVAGLVAIVASTHGGALGLGLKSTVVIALALVCPAVFMMAGLLLPPPYAGGETGGVMFGAYCLNSTVMWALLPIVSAGFALRGAFASGAVWRSGLLGAGSGLLAAALFTLHCPVVGELHIVAAHGGAVLVAAALGSLVLSRATRP